MVDEVITIPELQEALTASGTDQAVIRQGGIDKRTFLSTLKTYFASPASLSTVGTVQLNNSIDSVSTTEAATPNTVRLAYNQATTALDTANAALSGLSGKANTVHTHIASDIVSGVMDIDRLPKGNLSAWGVVRPTTSLSNPAGDSANGYVPSLQLINLINNVVNGITLQLETMQANGTYNRWDGGSSLLNPAVGRGSLGGTTVGQNFFTLISPNATRYVRINADNTISTLDANSFRAAIGVNPASDSVAGLAAKASLVLVEEGVNDDRFVTPQKLRFGVTVVLGVNGGIALPSWLGNIAFNWGQTTIPNDGNAFVSWPVPYGLAGQVYQFFGNFGTGGNNQNSGLIFSTSTSSPGLNGQIFHNGSSSSRAIRWWSVGRRVV